MKITKMDAEKSRAELTIELTADEFKPYVERAAEIVSREVKVEGFRPGKVPYDILKQKIGEMSILEEAANIAIRKTLDEAVKKNVEGEPAGQPKISITKLAPGNTFEYKVVLALFPEITLPDYKDMKVKQKKAEIAPAEVDKVINDLAEMKVSEAAVDRAVGKNDKVVADIRMSLDKVPVEGGQNLNASVIMGKNYIVPGFDEKLLGAAKGETKKFELAYPKDHHMKNLAGKNVDFEVVIKDVFERTLPARDDAFALGFGVTTVAELKTNIEQTLKNQKEKESSQAAEREMLEKIIAKTKFGDLPEILIDQEAHNMVHELEHAVEDQGGKFEDYLASIGKTHDQLMLDLLPDAIKRVKTSLLIREIAKVEKIAVPMTEVDKQAADMKKYYEQAGKDSPDAQKMIKQVETPEYKAYIASVLASRKVIDMLRESNITE